MSDGLTIEKMLVGRLLWSMACWLDGRQDGTRLHSVLVRMASNSGCEIGNEDEDRDGIDEAQPEREKERETERQRLEVMTSPLCSKVICVWIWICIYKDGNGMRR